MESPAVLGTMEGLILMSCRLSPLPTPRVFALLSSGSAQLTHAALRFTPTPLCRAATQTLALHPIPAAGYPHLSEGKYACIWVYMGATGTNLPELPTA